MLDRLMPHTFSFQGGMHMLAVDVNPRCFLLGCLEELFEHRRHHVFGGIHGRLLPAMAIKDPKDVKACT